MSHRIIIACIMWISIFAVIVMAGCSDERSPAQGSTAIYAANADLLRDGLRVRRDDTRSRIWLLGLDDVRVYNSVNKRLIRKIALPNWSVARLTCDPDIVLDSSGSAIISSNVQTRLWRIDASSFEVNVHEIRLQGREQWDAGFSALAITADGDLLALMSFGGSLWKVDLSSGTARMVAPGTFLFNACGYATQFRGKAAGGLDALTNFVPAAGSDYSVGAASTDIIPITSGLNLALERGRNP